MCNTHTHTHTYTQIHTYIHTHIHIHTQSYHLHFYSFCLSTLLPVTSALVRMCACVLISKLCGWVCNHLPAASQQSEFYRSTQNALYNYNSASDCHRYLAVASRLSDLFISTFLSSFLPLHSFFITSFKFAYILTHLLDSLLVICAMPTQYTHVFILHDTQSTHLQSKILAMITTSQKHPRCNLI